MFVESEGKLQSINDSFTNNTGLSYGGVLLATSGASYSVINASIIENYADSDSVVSAVKTSTLQPFFIDSCLFKNNQANSNLISLFQSNGLIQNSNFTDNKANTYTNNIFVIFSSLNLTNSIFKDENFAVPA